MTNAEMAELLLNRAYRIDATNVFCKSPDDVRQLSEEAASIRAGAEALRKLDRMEACFKNGDSDGAFLSVGRVLTDTDSGRILQWNAALREVARLRESLERISTGGNHLASALIHILGAGNDTFPPYETTFEAAAKIITDPIYMDLWRCWAVMMRERDVLRLEEPSQDLRDARIAELSQAIGLLTTLTPKVVMNTDDPLKMAREMHNVVTARIAELEARIAAQRKTEFALARKLKAAESQSRSIGETLHAAIDAALKETINENQG